MRALLFGAEGQLGRALSVTAPATVEVVGLGRQDCDLQDRSAIVRAIERYRPRVIINSAAYNAVDRAETDEAAAHAVNASAVAAMVEALEYSMGKLVHVSSDYVFDGQASRAYAPDAARMPQSAYGRSKAAGEDALRSDDLLVRTSWLYATGHRNFVSTMLHLMRTVGEVKVVEDQIGAPTWATSLAQTIWALVAKDAGGRYHHRDAGVASWYDFAVAIAEEAFAIGMLAEMPRVVPIQTSEYPTPAKRPRFSLLDCTATRSLLLEEPVHWRANLRRMLAEENAFG